LLAAACFPTGVWPPRMAFVPGNRRWSQLSVGNGHMCGRTVGSHVGGGWAAGVGS